MNTRKEIAEFFFGDYDRSTIISSFGSFLVSVIFAVYTGCLGVHYGSLWYQSICAYYVLLSALQAVLIVSDIRAGRGDGREKGARKAMFVSTHIILFVLNLSLFIPLALMATMQKPVRMTLIPAIAMAAYTTYKIIVASINMRRKKKTDNLVIKELRTINFIDALLSIAVLQNTLIFVNSVGDSSSMLTLSAWSSAVILGIMIAVSIFSYRDGKKALNS